MRRTKGCLVALRRWKETLQTESLIENIGRPPIKHEYREQNWVADALDKEGIRRKLFCANMIFVVPPVYANALCWAYMEGTMHAREISKYNCVILNAISEHIRSIAPDESAS